MGKKKVRSKSGGKKNIKLEQLEQGIAFCEKNSLFGRMSGYIRIRDSQTLGKSSTAIVTKYGEILLNQDVSLSLKQWGYVIAHCKLHLAFGHFDKEKMPENCEKLLWNFACDIFVAKFIYRFTREIFSRRGKNIKYLRNSNRTRYGWIGKSECI